MTKMMLILYFIVNIGLILSLPVNIEDNYSYNASPSLLVKHYDCQERKNLQRYNLVAVDKCEKTTSKAEHHNV